MAGKINHMLNNCQAIPMHANNRTVEIEVENKKYEGCFTCKGDPLQTSYGIILTHGAGGDMNNKQLVNIAEKLAGAGYLVLRFTCKGLNLGYRTKVFKGILSYLKNSCSHLKGCFIGGRSMGSRSAVAVCCDKTMIDFVLGVICLSYPLHRPKVYTQLRDEPLYEIRKPILFVSGTDDDMCKQELFLPVLDQLTSHDVHWIEGGNHGMDIKGKPIDDIIQEISHVIITWIQKTLVIEPKRTKKQSLSQKKLKQT